MKRSFKIILILSLIINACFISIEIIRRYQVKKMREFNVSNRDSYLRKTVDIVNVKNNFMDSLYKKYPQLKDKKYLFINIWDTGQIWGIKQLPMLDTLIEPLRSDFGYILINDEKPDYTARILRQDTGTTKNFLFMNQCEDFIYAVNQELRIPRRKYYYPKDEMNIILDNKGKIVYFDTLQSLSGPRYPEDSLKDRKHVRQLKDAINSLK